MHDNNFKINCLIELIVLPDEGNNIPATLILIVMYVVTAC